MNYAGVDFHKRYSVATVVDEEGQVLEKRKLENKKEVFAEFFAPYSEVSAVIEACRSWPIAAELLEEVVGEVKLAHPYKVRAIAEARIKTDSIDSEILAQLLRADLIPQAYLRGKENRIKQRILRARSFYVRIQTQIKNRVHYLVDIQDEQVRETAQGFTDLFGKKGLDWLKGLNLSFPDNTLLRDLLQTYEAVLEKIKETNWLVKDILEEDSDCLLLKTIPGLGDFLSVLVKVEIGDISRFRTSSHLSSYAGLTPSTLSSGGKTWHGRITKQGNKWLRWAMIEAVRSAIISNSDLRVYYEIRKRRKGVKAAKAATARRLLCIVYRVLKEKDTFKPYKNEFRKRVISDKLECSGAAFCLSSAA